MDNFTGFIIFVICLLAWINREYIRSLFNKPAKDPPNNSNVSMDNLPMTLNGDPVNGNLTLNEIFKMKILQDLDNKLKNQLMASNIKADTTKINTAVPSYGTSVNEMETPISPPLLQVKPANPTVSIIPIADAIAPTNSNISLQTVAPTYPTDWQCMRDDIPVPIRRENNANKDYSCMSLDNKNCLWAGVNNNRYGTTCSEVLSKYKNTTIKPLICGDMHKLAHGSDGYSDPNHWCAKLKATAW